MIDKLFSKFFVGKNIIKNIKTALDGGFSFFDKNKKTIILFVYKEIQNTLFKTNIIEGQIKDEPEKIFKYAILTRKKWGVDSIDINVLMKFVFELEKVYKIFIK